MPSTAAWLPTKPSEDRSACHENNSPHGPCSARCRCARHFTCASRRIDAPRQQLRGSARYCPGLERQQQIFGSPVYNDLNERIGSVDDIIVTFDKSVSYAIVNAGGFLAVAKHDGAVPVSQLKLVDGKLVLPGATRQALKDVPPFEYAR